MPPDNNQALPVNPSLGGFLGNIFNDVGQDVQGIAQLPALAGNLVQPGYNYAQGKVPLSGIPLPGVPSLNIPQTLTTAKDIAGNYLANLNRDVGQPFNTQTNQFQVPEVQKAAANFYSRPLNTVLDVLPFAQAGKAALAGKTAEGAKLATAASPLEETGNAILRSQYKLSPSQARATNLGASVGKLADYGFTNADKIRNIIPQITGDSGALSKIVRDSVVKGGPIDVSGLLSTTKNLLNNEELITESAARKAQNVVAKAVDNMGGETVAGGDASKAFQFLQDIEGKASTLSKGNDEAQALSRVYRGVADEVRGKLFDRPGIGIDPESLNKYIGTVEKLSPKLAQEVRSAANLQDVRSLQAPFVRMGKAIGISDSVMDNAILSQKDLGAGLIGSIIGGGPAAATTILAEKIMGTNLAKTAIGGALRGAGGALSAIPKSLGVGGPVLSALGSKTAQADQTTNQYSPKDNHIITPDQIISQQVNKDVTDPFSSGLALRSTDIQNQLTDIQQQKTSPRYVADPFYANQLDQQEANLKTQQQTSQKIEGIYTDTQSNATQFYNALGALQEAPTSILNRSDWLNILKQNYQPQYNALIGAVDALKGKGGFNPDNVLKVDGPSALSYLNSQKSQMLTAYNAYLKTYGQTQMKPVNTVPNVIQQQSQSQVPQGLPATPTASMFGSPNINFPTQ